MKKEKKNYYKKSDKINQNKHATTKNVDKMFTTEELTLTKEQKKNNITSYKKESIK